MDVFIFPLVSLNFLQSANRCASLNQPRGDCKHSCFLSPVTFASWEEKQARASAVAVDSRLALWPQASNFHIIPKIPEKSSVIDHEAEDQSRAAESAKANGLQRAALTC